MKEYMVCHDGDKIISHYGKDETESMVREGDVSWIISNGQKLDSFEIDVYRTYLDSFDPENGIVPSNKSMAKTLSSQYDRRISRNAVARARRRVANKLGFKPGW